MEPTGPDGGWPGWGPPQQGSPQPPPQQGSSGWGQAGPGPPPGGGHGEWPGWAPGPVASGSQGPGLPGLAPKPKGGGPRTGPLPLHPMTLGDILDGAFNLLKAEFRTLMIVSAVFIVPVQMIAAFLQRDLLGGLGLLDIAVDPTTTDAQLESGSTGQGIALLLAAGGDGADPAVRRRGGEQGGFRRLPG